MRIRVQWFARGGNIKRTGPFKSQAEAVKAMLLLDGGFPANVFVWPEEVEVKKPKRTRKVPGLRLVRDEGKAVES